MQDNLPYFKQIFNSMMLFCLLVAIGTVATVSAWPWEKTAPVWKPAFRLVVSCAGEPKHDCGLGYGELADARTNGRLAALTPTQAQGELEQDGIWLRWKQVGDQLEVKASSWYFQTTIRYRIENDAPVITAYQDIAISQAFTFGLGAAVFMMFGLYLRRLRR